MKIEFQPRNVQMTDGNSFGILSSQRTRNAESVSTAMESTCCTLLQATSVVPMARSWRSIQCPLLRTSTTSSSRSSSQRCFERWWRTSLPWRTGRVTSTWKGCKYFRTMHMSVISIGIGVFVSMRRRTRRYHRNRQVADLPNIVV